MRRFDQIRAELTTMAPLPAVVQRLLATMTDPDYEVDEVVELVRRDPVLTARLLRLVNSALVGNQRAITTIHDAVAYAGTRNLIKIVLVSCTATHFANVPASDYANGLWHHTIACATVCQHLAQQAGVQPELAFTLGILHNVGKIAIARAATDWSYEPAPNTAVDLCAAEREHFGIDHAAASGIVAEAWQLPAELADPLQTHHATPPTSPAAAVLELADTLAMHAGFGNPIATDRLTHRAQTLQFLDLDAAGLAVANTHLMEQMILSEELLNLNSLVGR